MKRIVFGGSSSVIILSLFMLLGCSNPEHTEYSDEHVREEHDEQIVKLDEKAQEMIQLEIGAAEEMIMEKRIKVYGKIAQDTGNYSYITAGMNTQVEKLLVKLGDIVEKDTPLLVVKKDDGTSKEITSSMHGTILTIHVKPGEMVDSVKSLISIINLDLLRVTLDVYEKDLNFVKIGQAVEIKTIAFPGKKFTGKVVYISPRIDEETQSVKIRAEVNNSKHFLRLGMFVSGELIIASDREVLAVPKEAVQQLNGEDIVFVVDGKNTFRIREVILGRTMGDYVEIKDGLQKEEKVVTQGSFYLKSEQTKESFEDGHAH